MNPSGQRTLLELGALICAGSILALIGLQSFAFAPLKSNTATMVVFFVQAAPIVALAPALLTRRKSAIFWMALVSLLYFVHGVFQVVSPAVRTVGVLEIAFSLTLFGVCIALLRVDRTSVQQPPA